MKKLFLIMFSLLVVSMFFVIGCKTSIEPAKDSLGIKLDNVNIKPEYTIELTDSYNSHAGDVNLEIKYGIINEQYDSCEGTYHFLSSDGEEKINKCELNKIGGAQFQKLKLKTMSNIIDEVKITVKGVKTTDLSKTKSIKVFDRDCFKFMLVTNVLICFNQENFIVNYAKEGDPVKSRYRWNLEGYKFTPEIEALIT